MTRKTVKKVDTILALDPGLRDLGYAVLRRDQLLTAGVLPLRAVPADEKLAMVKESILTWIRAYEPSTLVLERIPERPLDLLAGLPALGRLLHRVANREGLDLATYSARAVRQTVVSDGWAGKREVAEALLIQFPELRVYLGHDRKWKDSYWFNMFDAVALARHHQNVTQPPSRGR